MSALGGLMSQYAEDDDDESGEEDNVETDTNSATHVVVQDSTEDSKLSLGPITRILSEFKHPVLVLKLS